VAKNKAFLYGKNSVQERIKQDPGSIREIFLQDNFDTPAIATLIKSARIPTKKVSEKELLRIKRADRLQGVVAEVDAFKYASFDDLLERPVGKQLSFIFLDNINDPHNLGSVIRIAACFGGFSVVIPSRNSCQVTDAVVHVASGGENFVPVCVVNNLSNALRRAKKYNYWIAGTVVSKGEHMHQASLPFPLCLVLGSEGKGIREGIDKLLDIRLTLPMKGASLSFNVAMASAIFCYEIDRQRS